MDELFDTAEKKVLVDMVRLAQKHGMKGIKGDWKEFLDFHDKKLGASLSDPTRRSIDMLSAFLKTFTKEDDLKFFAKIMQCHLKRNLVDQLTKTSADDEIPEQRLVRLTLEHPQYPSDYSFPSNDEEWVVIKLSKKSKVMRSNAMLAVDCEMVLCEDGSEALVRICVVDRNLQVKLDEHVNPGKAVADYRTDITGISATDLKGIACSLADVQKSMKMLLFKGTILVGHSLNNDLKALKMDHARVIDTALIFKYLDGSINRRPSLNNLCKSVLGYEVRKKGAPHNCLDDACAAMKLVLAKLDNGVDKAIPLVQEDVPESEMAKLLLHRIPNNVPPEELHKVIPADFTIELKPSRKVRGDKYSAFAIFKNPHEAHQAYETVKGSQEKDSLGRPQKLVELKLTTGMVTSLYVRKMAHDDSLGQISFKKRAFQAEETPGASKMLKTNPKTEEDSSNQCCDDLVLIERKKQELSKRERGDPNHSCDHLKEIERLKQELIERDVRLTAQDKIITDLSKRLNSRHGKRRPKV
ncbi:small RNA degrading nuclease 1-like isoform X1 [Juglans microcarpa x Juglans regia]|uniref:small RNA degrading nuclease 1-like isoform X1 n=1 Tax=Juglans microcarpa x Juglans regia TaxID=2249226 RepID=UPI001B7D9EDB|nr:small RNA degrading nuclease 1-like isoform X1 [Juglans microcarpa x Juglans regia]